jgi:hypothetical protein
VPIIDLGGHRVVAVGQCLGFLIHMVSGMNAWRGAVANAGSHGATWAAHPARLPAESRSTMRARSSAASACSVTGCAYGIRRWGYWSIPLRVAGVVFTAVPAATVVLVFAVFALSHGFSPRGLLVFGEGLLDEFFGCVSVYCRFLKESECLCVEGYFSGVGDIEAG